MIPLSIIYEAWISIGTSRLRTFLAMLGIIIGVGSVVLMVAVGSGSREAVEASIRALGSNQMTVMLNYADMMSLQRGRPISFDMQDVAAIAELPSVDTVAPATFPRSFPAETSKHSAKPQVTGSTRDWFSIENWQFGEGDAFTDDEAHASQRVAVIGASVAKVLFPDEAEQGGGIAGRTIQINHVPFRITGVLKSKGSGMEGGDQDNIIVVPISVAQTRLWEYGGNIISQIIVRAVNFDRMDEASEDVMAVLRQRHHVPAAARDPFMINNMEAVMQTMSDTSAAVSTLLAAIASISLIVGGIGIMNIMLVTVTERTREIGIRKAIGATKGQILTQFLLEAMIIAIVGSMTGLLCGIGIGLVAQAWFAIPVAYSLWSVVISLSGAVGIGLASGLYPAMKAARLQPIDALRIM